MARKIKNTLPYIYVFCEGESEQVYARFLKDTFSEVAVLYVAKFTGLFEEAQSHFDKDIKYKNTIDSTDEIWFFFDVENDDISKWDSRLKIIKHLRRMRKKPNIRIRLLMTTGCIEYWLMLHYQKYVPIISEKKDKDNILEELKTYVPTYFKGDKKSTESIAQNYPIAVNNSKWTVEKLLQYGLPGLEDTDERNRWLCTNCKTFSNVYEAIEYLESLKSENCK